MVRRRRGEQMSTAPRVIYRAVPRFARDDVGSYKLI